MNILLRLTLLIVVFVVAACGNTSPSPSGPALVSPAPPSASASASAGLPAAPSAVATAAPATAAPSAPASAAPSSALVPVPVASADLAGVADLTTVLPDTVGGFKLTKGQFSGDEFAASGSVSQQMVDLLASIGRKPKDMTMATADDPSRKTDFSVAAFRIRDIPVQAFLDVYLPALQAAYGDGSITKVTRAGRPVYVVVRQGGLPPQVLLPVGDVLFVVSSATDALVDEALTKLP